MPLDPTNPYAALFEDEVGDAQKLQASLANMGNFGPPADVAKAAGVAAKTGNNPLDMLDPEMRAISERAAKLAGIPVDRLAGTKTAKWLTADPLNIDMTGGNFASLVSLEERLISAEKARVAAENQRTGRGVTAGLAASTAKGGADLGLMPQDFLNTIVSAVLPTEAATAFRAQGELSAVGPINVGALRASEKWLASKQRTTENVLLTDPGTGEQIINWGAVNPLTGAGLENISNMVAGEAVPMLAQMLVGAAAAPVTGGASLGAVGAANAGKLAKLGRFGKAVWSYAKSPVSVVNAGRVVTGQAQSGVQELMAKGMSEEEAWSKVAPGALLSGLFSAAAGSPLEAKIMEDLLAKASAGAKFHGFLNKAAARMKSFISQGAKEGSQELVEGLGEDLAAFITYSPDKTMKEFAANAVMNFVGGASMGGVLGAGIHGSRSIHQAENAAFIQSLHDEKARAEFSQHAPERYADFVSQLTEGGELEQLPVDAKEFTTYYQSIGVDPKTFATEQLGVAGEDFDIAVQNGGDLMVPTGAYAQHIAGTDHFANVYDFTRASQGGPTLRELHESQINTTEVQRLQDAMQQLPATDPERDVLRDKVAAQLTAASRTLTVKQATEIADGYAKVLTVMAARAGMTPTQLYEKNKLNISKDFHSKLENQKGADYAFTEAGPDQLAEAAQVQGADAGRVAEGLRTGPGRSDGGLRGEGLGRKAGFAAGVAPPPMLWHGTTATGITALKAEGLGKPARGGMGSGLHVTAGPQVMTRYAEGNVEGNWRVGVSQDFRPFDASNEKIYSVEEADALGVVVEHPMTGYELWSFATAAEGIETFESRLQGLGFDGLYYAHGGEDAWSVWKDAKLVGSRPTDLATAEADYARQGSRRDELTGQLKVAQTPADKILFQPAYHGSPYRFDKFSLAHLGSGEGAQAYGWGLYFAGSKEVAEYYRNTLSQNSYLYDGKLLEDGTPQQIAAEALAMVFGNKEEALDDLKFYGATSQEKTLMKKFIKSADYDKLSVNRGQLYTVDIPDDETMLLWDKPLSEQPEAVWDKLAAAANRGEGRGDEVIYQLREDAQDKTHPNYGEASTGRHIYEILTDELGGQEAASKYLNELGLSGIKYLDGTSRAKGEGAYNYVIFDDSAVSVLNTYYEGGELAPRGYLQFGERNDGTPRNFNLVLLENENKSTVFHELGHFYLEMLGDLAERPGSAQGLKDDYATILKWFGVSDRKLITTEMHEKFADAHLVYLSEGKAPTSELASSFRKFSKWLAKIGQQLLGVEVNMTDEVRGVFDRLYASDQELEAAQADITTRMFTTAEQAGMSKAEFAAYSKAIAKEAERAKEQLTAKLMKELDRQQKKDYRDEYDREWGLVNDEVLQRPEYAAAFALSNGVMEDGQTPIKLNRQQLVARYGEDLPAQLVRDGGFVYSTDLPTPDNGVVDADTAAMQLGFGSGDELVQALTGLTPRTDLVESITKQRMEDKHPTLMGDPEALRTEATKLLNGEMRGDILATELRLLRKKQAQARPLVKQALTEQAEADRAQRREAQDLPKLKEFRRAAENYVSGISAWKLRPNTFLVNQRRAAKEAFTLSMNNDYKGAAEAKERELLNHYLHLEAVKAKEEAEDFRDWVKRNDSATVRGKMGKAGGTFLAQFDTLRDRFSIEREPNKALARRESLASWAKAQTDESNDATVAEWLMDETIVQNYQELTLTQMRELRDALKNIKHLAYLELGTIIDGKRVEYADMMEQFEQSFAASMPNRKPLMRSTDKRRDKASAKIGAVLQGLDSTMVKIEALVNWIDGNNVNGAAHKYIWDRIVKAQLEDYKLTLDFNKVLLDALEQMPKEQRNALDTDTYDIGMTDLDGQSAPVTRGEILTMLLYSGQETRKQKLLAGYGSRGLNENTLNKAFSKLTKEDFAFASSVWATFDKLSPMILDLEERLTGIRPKWEQAAPFEVYDERGNFLAQLSGGYFPLVADSALTGELGKKQEGGTVQQIMSSNGYSRATTSTGHTKELTGATYPLLLDFQRILTSELTNQIKDLTHREAVLSVNRILRNNRFQALVKEHVGEAYEAQLMPWLANVVSDRNAGASDGMASVNRFMLGVRSNTVAAVLGFKYTSMIVQLADIVRVVGPGDFRVKGRYLTAAYAKLAPGNPERKATIEKIEALSSEMVQRKQNLDRDLRARLEQLKGDESPAAKWNRAAFSGLAMMDALVSWPTWLGAYEQAMAEHGDQDRAVKEADRTVRMRLMTGAPKDLTPIQANKHWAYKAITMFMGDATSNYNAMRNAGHNITGLKGIPTFTGTVAVVMLASIIGDWLKGMGPDDDEDEAAWVARKAVLAPFNTAPVIRDIAALADNVVAGKPFTDYKFSPAFTAVQKVAVDPLLHTKRFASGDEEMADYAMNLLESGGYAFGIGGTAQAKASAKYLKRYMEGEEQPDNPAQFSYDLIRGKRKER